MTGTVNNVIKNRHRDCLGCKIFSGCGLIGSGLYVSHHAKKFQPYIGKSMMYTIGGGLLYLGSARILDLPPFRKQLNHG